MSCWTISPCIFCLRMYSSLLWYQGQMEQHVLFTHSFLKCLATSPSQPRLMKKVSYQLWTHSYHYAPLFSKSWATLVQLSPFLKDPAPGMAGIGSVGSHGEMKAPWGSSITLAKAFAPRRYCLGVTLVKPTSSWLSSCHCLWQTTSNSSGGIH